MLVVCNPATLGLGERLRGEAGRAGADAVLALMAERASHAAEPPASIAAAMEAADVVLAPTVQSLSHTASRKAATEAGARIATLPGVTEEMLARVMSADMAELRRKGAAVADAAHRGERGADHLRQRQRPAARRSRAAPRSPTPASSAPRRLRQPARAARASSPRSRAAARAPWSSTGRSPGSAIPAEPVRMSVVDGRLAEATGDEGAQLLELLRGHGEEATHRRRARDRHQREGELTGNVLEDEKILGTVHVAFGASAAIGGTIQVPVHLDCVVHQADGRGRRHRGRPGGRVPALSSGAPPMLLAVPNVSAGPDRPRLAELERAYRGAGDAARHPHRRHPPALGVHGRRAARRSRRRAARGRRRRRST